MVRYRDGRNITVKIPKVYKDALRELAKEIGGSMSLHINLALREYLGSYGCLKSGEQVIFMGVMEGMEHE